MISLQLAAEFNIKYMETSAKSGQNIEESFKTLVKDIKMKKDQKLVGIFVYFHDQVSS